MMKFSKTSVIILLLLFAIMGVEFYYHKQQIKTEKSALSEKGIMSAPQEQNRTKRDSSSSRTPDTVAEKENLLTDDKIISTVTAYRKGYKEGCQKASETNTTDTQAENHLERAYILGFQQGKTECLSQIKQKKENYDLGYKDGCNSAINKLLKNTALYSSSVDYKKGWDRGADKCGSKNENVRTKKPEKSIKNVNKKSPNYQMGYRHGCTSAKGNYIRQEDIYLQSRAYRQGWTLGRQKCKSTQKSLSPAQKRHYFDQGYRDGCDSARGYYRRDHYKYKNIMSYREGWRAGEYECSGY